MSLIHKSSLQPPIKSPLRGCRKTPICCVTLIPSHSGVLLCTPHSSGFRKPYIWTFSISLSEAGFSTVSKPSWKHLHGYQAHNEIRPHSCWLFLTPVDDFWHFLKYSPCLPGDKHLKLNRIVLYVRIDELPATPIHFLFKTGDRLLKTVHFSWHNLKESWYFSGLLFLFIIVSEWN